MKNTIPVSPEFYTVQHVILCKFTTKQSSTYQTCLSDSTSATCSVTPTIYFKKVVPQQSTSLSRRKFTPPMQLSNASGRTQSRSYKRKTGTRLIALFQFPGMIKTSSPIFLKCTLLPLLEDTTWFLRSHIDKSPRWGISAALGPIACRHVC